MKARLLTLFILISAIHYSYAQTINLFNGKNLDGWYADVPDSHIAPSFIVRDQKLVSMGDPRGHLITNESFSNYRIEATYRFPGKPGNCGILVHVSQPRVLYNMFPKSIEVQMQHLDAGDFWCIGEDISVPDMEERRGDKSKWGTTAGKLRRIKNLTDSSEKPLGQWNKMIIECLDNKIKVWVNGDLVNDGYDCTASQGKIAIQAEGAEVEFKTLKLKHISKFSK
ncbi:3-keto-disaccharide hydrolase [Pedobacter montanisoli]|uniref:DUF1080 domain-containing protein n=1 Tax=Pedobacter montanisoli TaxID=2923277 RepID=A0ABS9ZSH6_9SPHI|nr:DUF1080 domain-containing protein [Pedobacter montanisoli]MCJ0741202.1 DUF1080 domain-containing protein [Pedobacter montanisoli]